MKRILGISLGSEHRNFKVTVHLNNTLVHIERIGVHGDYKKAQKLFRDLDGTVDVFGLGGIDFNIGYDRQFKIPIAYKLIKDVKKTPVVDGAGLRPIVDKLAVHVLMKKIDLTDSNVMQIVSVNRQTMAKNLVKHTRSMVFGDFLYGIGLPIPLRNETAVKLLSNMIVPIISKLPHHWYYPVGERQKQRKPKYEKYFLESDIISGDTHYILRYSPKDLRNKIILATSLINEDFHELFNKGVRGVVSPSPNLGGRCFGTNIMEATLAAFLEPKKIGHQRSYLELIDKFNFLPHTQFID